LRIGTDKYVENTERLKAQIDVRDILVSVARGDSNLRLGLLSSWNVPCGIAEYSGHLCRALPRGRVDVVVFSDQGAGVLQPDEPFVRRPWTNSLESLPSLIRTILAERIECLLVQFHSGFYPPAVLATLIDELTEHGVAVAIIFHVIPRYEYDLRAVAPSFAKAVLLVHRQSDADYFSSLGLTDAEILPHGIFVPPGLTCERASRQANGSGVFTVGAFGFLRPHKGFLELMAACHLSRARIPELQVKIYASAYPSEDSAKLLTRCHAYMTYLDNRGYTEFNSDFLEAGEVPRRLQSCDVVVFPYQRTQESSSAAVRMGLASGRPVLCTPLAIFEDVRDAVLFTDGFDAFAIAKGVLDLHQTPDLASETRRRQQRYLDNHRWERVAELLLEKLPVREGKPVTA
jgi:glycosyltransferase involved in cell wall biosynthesis